MRGDPKASGKRSGWIWKAGAAFFGLIFLAKLAFPDREPGPAASQPVETRPAVPEVPPPPPVVLSAEKDPGPGPHAAQPQTTAPPPISPVVLTGDVILDDGNGIGTGPWLVFSASDIGDYIAAQHRIDVDDGTAGRGAARYRMASEGRIEVISNGTRARVVEPGNPGEDGFTRITVESGESSGKSGWMMTRCLRPAGR